MTPTTAAEIHGRLVGMVYPGSLQISPGGDQLALVAPAQPKAQPTVHILDLDDKRPPDVWSNVPEEVSLVRWSTDGSHLWVVTRPDREPCRLHRHDAATGARLGQIDLAGAIEDAWPLDATSLLLRLADPGSERDGMHLGLRVTQEEPRVDAPDRSWRRLVVVATSDDGLTCRPLELQGWTVWDVDVRDGRLAMVASRNPLPAGYYQPALLTARMTRDGLTDVTEVYRSSWQLARPCLAPDTSTVFVLEGLSIVSGQLLRVDLTSGHVHTLPELDDITDVGVDGNRLWFTGWHRTGVQVGTVSDPLSSTPKVARWTAQGTLTGDSGQPSLALVPGSGRAYGVWEDPTHPPEVIEMWLDRPDRTAITGFNHGLIDLADTVTMETIRWNSADGTEVEGLLLRPLGASDRLPLVTLLHGGPTWLWSAAFAPAESNHLALALAASGAAVLLPNPRGSSGRGQAYAREIIGRMGTIDLDDVLSGVEELLASGVADPERLAVMGLSYGGYLSAVAAARSQRFKAAVVMSGVVDWLSFGTTSAIGGGYDRTYHPDSDSRQAAGRERLADRSPVYDEHPQRTPTLVLHGAEDRITPLAQAEQLYRSRAAQGISTELVVYAGEGHELVDPDHRADACERVLSWLVRHGALS